MIILHFTHHEKFRIKHTENHSYVCDNQENAHKYCMQLQLAHLVPFPADYTCLKQQHSQERYYA